MSAAESDVIEATGDAEATAGARLRQAREALKLSVQDVAGKIRIDASKVEALENGDVEGIGAAVFAAGYIRAYARIVSLPADELIAAYDGIGRNDEIVIQPVETQGTGSLGRVDRSLSAKFSVGGAGRKRRRLLRGLVIVSLFIVIAGGAFWLLNNDDATMSAVDDDVPVALPEVASSEETAQNLSIPGLASASTESTAAESSVAQQLDTPPSSLAGEEAMPEETSTTPPSDKLLLQFQDDSWLEVYDARNTRLAHRLARAGSTLELQGEAPFSLVVGYVPGVSILFNGDTVDLSGYQGRRLVRFSVGDNTHE